MRKLDNNSQALRLSVSQKGTIVSHTLLLAIFILLFFLRLRARDTSVSMTGISISGPTTVDTATIGIEANAVRAMAMASSKFLPVLWNAIVAESS